MTDLTDLELLEQIMANRRQLTVAFVVWAQQSPEFREQALALAESASNAEVDADLQTLLAWAGVGVSFDDQPEVILPSPNQEPLTGLYL